jgi:hypothetical protein
LASTRSYEVAVELAAEGARELSSLAWRSADTPELLLAGSRVERLEVQAESDGAWKAALNVIDSDSRARDLHLLDVDADGKRDLVGYEHPRLVAWLDARDSSRKRGLVRLQGAKYSVLHARLAHLDGDGRWDALVLAGVDSDDPAIVLFAAHNLPNDREGLIELELDPEPAPLRSTPFSRSLELR